MQRKNYGGAVQTYHFSRMPGRKKRRLPIPVSLYDSAITEMAYGKPQMMGDLFNDVMGAIIPGWDQRPEALKKIQIKPNPATLITNAMKVVPPSRVGNLMRTVNSAGFDAYYNTPAGAVPVTPSTAEGLYANFPAFLRGNSMLSGIPTWVYMAGGMGLFLLVFMSARKH